MDTRSYVCPSHAITGSQMTSCVMGQKYSEGHWCPSRRRRVPSPPPRGPSRRAAGAGGFAASSPRDGSVPGFGAGAGTNAPSPTPRTRPDRPGTVAREVWEGANRRVPRRVPGGAGARGEPGGPGGAVDSAGSSIPTPSGDRPPPSIPVSSIPTPSGDGPPPSIPVSSSSSSSRLEPARERHQFIRVRDRRRSRGDVVIVARSPFRCRRRRTRQNSRPERASAAAHPRRPAESSVGRTPRHPPGRETTRAGAPERGLDARPRRGAAIPAPCAGAPAPSVGSAAAATRRRGPRGRPRRSRSPSVRRGTSAMEMRSRSKLRRTRESERRQPPAERARRRRAGRHRVRVRKGGEAAARTRTWTRRSPRAVPRDRRARSRGGSAGSGGGGGAPNGGDRAEGRRGGGGAVVAPRARPGSNRGTGRGSGAPDAPRTDPDADRRPARDGERRARFAKETRDTTRAHAEPRARPEGVESRGIRARPGRSAERHGRPGAVATPSRRGLHRTHRRKRRVEINHHRLARTRTRTRRGRVFGVGATRRPRQPTAAARAAARRKSPWARGRASARAVAVLPWARERRHEARGSPDACSRLSRGGVLPRRGVFLPAAAAAAAAAAASDIAGGGGASALAFAASVAAISAAFAAVSAFTFAASASSLARLAPPWRVALLLQESPVCRAARAPPR